ncbi:MAG: FkbM family methyltransferase [Elusimicrobiota bacterium]|jgi:FkbM family methyltransferase|nr:FkbM family methyltransferase [Elusimicrobiota bacterium]
MSAWENRDETQYEYHQGNVNFDIREGDIIIDGGGCFGDTALEFANKAGEKGKVFSFEFVGVNLEIFNKNLALNPELTRRIEIVQKALWKNSNEELFFSYDLQGDGSGAAKCVPDKPQNIESSYASKIETISIDDFVSQNNLPRVDFIKLDIEGAEYECLQGAKETIKKFKPRIAVCIYHKDEDFIRIPAYLKELVPEYKLYLNHHTDMIEETVLYAMID